MRASVMQEEMKIPYRRFGTIYQSHIQVPIGHFTLKVGPIGCFETSVKHYRYSLRNSKEYRSSKQNVLLF
jgi:hypothetical protein